jgi:hypothetical protein
LNATIGPLPSEILKKLEIGKTELSKSSAVNDTNQAVKPIRKIRGFGRVEPSERLNS